MASTADELIEVLAAHHRRAFGLGDGEAAEAAEAAFEALCDVFGGDRVYIPAQRISARKRDRAIARDYIQGADVPTLARRYQISPRRIQQIIQRTELDCEM